MDIQMMKELMKAFKEGTLNETQVEQLNSILDDLTKDKAEQKLETYKTELEKRRKELLILDEGINEYLNLCRELERIPAISSLDKDSIKKCACNHIYIATSIEIDENFHTCVKCGQTDKLYEMS